MLGKFESPDKNPLVPQRYANGRLIWEPDLEKVEQFFELLNIRLKNTILFLGCMQPKGRYREKLQMVALRSGVRVVVKPVEGLIRMLRENEIEYEEFDECCSFVGVDEVEDETY